MKKMLQEIIEKQPKFSTIAPLKTKEIVHWCRIHGYTPPDPESSSDDQESIEDVLTRIDNEACMYKAPYPSLNQAMFIVNYECRSQCAIHQLPLLIENSTWLSVMTHWFQELLTPNNDYLQI